MEKTKLVQNNMVEKINHNLRLYQKGLLTNSECFDMCVYFIEGTKEALIILDHEHKEYYRFYFKTIKDVLTNFLVGSINQKKASEEFLNIIFKDQDLKKVDL